MRDDLAGQVGRDARDDTRDRLLDEVGLEFLDHLLGGCVGRVQSSFTDCVPDPTDRCVKRAVGSVPGAACSPADESTQSLVGI